MILTISPSLCVKSSSDLSPDSNVIEGLIVTGGIAKTVKTIHSGLATFGTPDSKGVTDANAKDTIVLPFNDILSLEECLKKQNKDIAAIILEPVPCNNGLVLPNDGYLSEVRELCNKHNILLISDEVMSGFGRTGEWFGVDHYNVVPDIMVMAKGLTSGYLPLGAMTVTDTIANHFNDNPMIIGLTYSAHPLSCAAALENIKIIRLF